MSQHQEHDAVLPRTDGERHLGDGRMPSTKEMHRTDEETIRMMEEIGFDSSMPIDPSSLKALQELLTPKRSHGKSIAKDTKQAAVPNLAKEEIKEESSLNVPQVPSEVLRPIALGRVTSDLTMGLRSESMIEERSDASTAGSTQRAAASNMDKRILDQLQMQTQLLLDLQRRVDELSQIVITQQGQLQQQASDFGQARSIPSASNQQTGGTVPPVQQQAPQQQDPRNAHPPPQPAAPQEQQQMFLFAFVTGIPNYIRSTRVAEMCRVFWALHKRDMGGRIDFNMLIKILFMGAILFAKFSNSSRRRGTSLKNSMQMYLAIVLIVGGFLMQSGYARFLYNFFVKERYVQRIWSGEEIDVAAQPRPARPAEQRAQRQDDQGRENEAEGPGLLQGGIAQAPAHGGMIGKFVMDIVYLFGSFILSILPMWKAEAQQPRGGQRNNNQRQLNGQENAGDGQGDGNG